MTIGFIVNLAYQYADNVAFLLLAALGLIIILGVLDIINLAHGEMIMMGAYVTSIANRQGLPLWLCFLISTLIVGLFGFLIERLVIRRFAQDKLGAMVATWGISLILSQGVLVIFGPSMPPVPLPQWKLAFGGYSYSGYRLFLFGMAIAVTTLLWLYFYKVRIGVFTRATMQNASMAQGLGINTDTIGSLTFAVGAGLAGLTGALYAPTTTIVPLMGTTFTAMAFITVVVGGGANPILGALGSSTLLSVIVTPLSSTLGTFIGRIGLLLAALVIIRFLPTGISGFLRDLRRRKFDINASEQ
ncbi:MAG: branched-chain amino acid ABC transporter permease [Deltaproteobacteria bacterium]|nr:branched-chain amino acid ABC transporter permease [Deltaproteobacteria bacterium]